MTISLIPAHVCISCSEKTGTAARGVTFQCAFFTFAIKFGFPSVSLDQLAKGVDSYMGQQATSALMRCCSPICNVGVTVTTVKTLILCSHILCLLWFYALFVCSWLNATWTLFFHILCRFLLVSTKIQKLDFTVVCQLLASHTQHSYVWEPAFVCYYHLYIWIDILSRC
jgi:hypothetical protein